MACSSDSGTIHIFSLKSGNAKESKNTKSKLAIFGFINNYFNSEWSFAQYKVSDKKTKVGFLKDRPNILLVASTEGRLYYIEFNPDKGGDCDLKKIFDISKEGKEI